MQSQQLSKPATYRSRSGCWTCRARKKKCDSLAIPCGTCIRLGLHCERNVRLVWEDDTRRAGMKRRGRPKSDVEKCNSNFTARMYPISCEVANKIYHDNTTTKSPCRELPLWPADLDQAQSRLLDHYIQRFSRTYPAFSGPSNPFLSILLPLATQNRIVLDALLALSGAQTWENGRFAYQDTMASLRQKSLRGCMNLVARIINDPRPKQNYDSNGDPSLGIDLAKKIRSGETDILQNQDFLYLLAICVLLILYEKLTIETGGGVSAHIQFLAKVVPCQLVLAIVTGSAACSLNHWQKEPFWFFSSLFLYNDLVQSTSLRIPTLSEFYATTMPRESAMCRAQIWLDPEDRFYFPRLIARIGAGDRSVSDADIALWDGRLDWFPSFALHRLEPPENNEKLPVCDPVLATHPDFQNIKMFSSISQWEQSNLISELYRIAAIIYRRGFSIQNCSDPSPSIPCDANRQYPGNLPSWAIQLIEAVPIESPFDNVLLWPIGIIAKEITESHWDERNSLVTKLCYLEQRFKQKNFYLVRQHLVRQWAGDADLWTEQDGSILFG